ncbi:MAG: DegV family protein [Clostridia bacterium]|nr:DegV family protein [Clostridia bacterium]
MEKIRIITDSGCDLPQNYNPKITILPMSIRFGDDEYKDGIDITTKQFYEKLIESDQLPTTSLVSPATFDDAFKTAVDNGEKVVVITIASKLSGTYQSAVLAAADYPNDVFVIDSKNVATAEQILVLRALELIEQGVSVEKIAKVLENEREKIHIVALLDTLEYLKKGGRISATVALVGGALSIKPVVTCKDGEVSMIGKARGSKNGNNFLIKEIESTSGIDFSKPLRLGYTGLTDALLQKYIEDSSELWAGHSDSIVVSHIGSTIGTHVGPGAIAVAFFAKD